MGADEIIFTIQMLVICVAIWCAGCHKSIRARRVSPFDLLALVFLIGYAFGLSAVFKEVTGP